jgi:microcystin-dependent protein
LQVSDQSFEDEFNENAKVAMDIIADERGRVLSATFQPRGSTTSNRKLIDIAERRAFELKLGTTGGGQKGTVIFNFKLRG